MRRNISLKKNIIILFRKSTSQGTSSRKEIKKEHKSLMNVIQRKKEKKIYRK